MRTLARFSTRLDFPSRFMQGVYRSLARLPFLPAPGMHNLTISDEKRFVWFRVAKVGTRTTFHHLKAAGVRLAAEHAHDVRYPVNRYRDYFKFAFVRNPWDRLVSCWQNKVVENNHFDFAPSELARMRKFENFVEFVAALDLFTCDPHLRLQSQLIDLSRIDFLGRLESFTQDLSTVFATLAIPLADVDKVRKNKTGKTDYRDYYTPALVDRVFAIYRRDVQVLHYEFDPAAGAAHLRRASA